MKKIFLFFNLIAVLSIEAQNNAVINVSSISKWKLDYGMGWNTVGQIPAGADNAWFKLLEWSGCHTARHSWNTFYIETQNDNNDPFSYNWSAFNLDNQYKSVLERTDPLEKLGIDYFLCNWDSGGWWQDCWMGPKGQFPYNVDEVGETNAALVHLMHQNGGHPHFKGISLQNEPDGAYHNPDGTLDWYPARKFWTLIKSADQHLKDLGERNTVQILGPETSGPITNDLNHINMLKENGTILDAVSDHLYQWFYGGFDYANPQKCIGNTAVPYYTKLKTDLKALYGHDVPVFLGEYSGRINSGQLSPSEIYDDNVMNSELAIRLMNVGVGGFMQWWFATTSLNNAEPWLNALTDDATYSLKPQASVYYPHAVIARYVGKNWDVMGQTTTGGTDTNNIQRLFTAVLKNPATADMTILAVNDDFISRNISISLAGVSGNPILHNVFVTGPVPDGLHQNSDITLSGGTATVSLPPRSVTALTTMPVGDLSLPEDFSIRRNWYNNDDVNVSYYGTWNKYNSSNMYFNDWHESDKAWNTCHFNFTGTGVSFTGKKGPSMGKADVWIDGQYMANVDLYQANWASKQVCFKSPTLTNGSHQILIYVTDQKNSNSTGNIVTIDAFQVEASNALGISNHDLQSNINLYPNPTKDIATIKGLVAGDKITITDVLGKIVLNTIAIQEEEMINTAPFTSGIYIVSVGDKTRLKLVKE